MQVKDDVKVDISPSQENLKTDEMPAQDKVKEMAQKLRIPLTPDLLQLGSNEKISSALIDKAVAAGRSEKEINSAMEKM